MVTILLVVASVTLLYGLIQLSETAFERWRPASGRGQNPIAADHHEPMLDNLAYGMTGIALDSTETGVGEAIGTEVAGETVAISEAITPIIESSQHFIVHGAEAIGQAMGEALSSL